MRDLIAFDIFRPALPAESLRLRQDEDIGLMNALTLVSMFLLAVITYYGYQMGWFTSMEKLQALVGSVGLWAPLVFIVLQVLQVVFPIIPGGLGCLAGVILFGPLWGFVYNYVGIVFGSMIVFGISKVYGRSFVETLFPVSLTEKYYKWMDKKDTYKKWFAAAIFFPIAPDDLLCYIAGTTKMKWKEYTAIIVLGKPASIALYSLGLTTLFRYVLSGLM